MLANKSSRMKLTMFTKPRERKSNDGGTFTVQSSIRPENIDELIKELEGAKAVGNDIIWIKNSPYVKDGEQRYAIEFSFAKSKPLPEKTEAKKEEVASNVKKS